MIKNKYIFGKRTSRKQIVYYCYDYKGHSIIYRFSFPIKKGASKSYYTDLVDKKVIKLSEKGKLERHAIAYIRKMKYLLNRKRRTIVVAITAAVAVMVTVGVLTTYFVYFHPDSITLDSETLTLNKNSTRLHQDADITFTVKEFYADYGYSAPVKMDKVIVNDVTLTPEQYTYSDNHLRIGAEYMTGKVYIAAEADYVHFENDTWDNIIAYANRGLRDTYIRYGRRTVVGAEHDIEINNVTKKVRVIGEGHDRIYNPLATGTKAATLTLELIDPIGSTAYNSNPSEGNADIYSNSTLKDYCANFLAKSIPSKIANEIREVSKTTAVIDGDVITETNHYKVFPLSYREIGGECGQYVSGLNHVMEESCYQYYADPYDDSLLAKRQRNASYWLRTPFRRGDSCANYVDEEGYTGFKELQKNELNVVVAFAIGETESFITDSWENVCEQANMGYDNLKDYYGINSFLGLEREIILSSDAEHPATIVRARVIGEKHDHLAAGADLASALTFEFVDSPDKVAYGEDDYGINTKKYHDSLIRNYMNNTLFKRFPLDLKGNVQKVIKKTVIPEFNEDTELSYENTEEYLFPLSLKESGDIFYSLAHPYNAEEQAYDIFRLNIDPNYPDPDLNAIDRLRNHGIAENEYYWLRSLPQANSANCTNADGMVTDKFYKSFTSGVTNEKCCFPAFNIGYAEEEPTFATDDWENVCYYAERGIDALKEAYGLRSFIGQQREMILNDGTKAFVQVIGENEDKTVDGKDTVLTFEFTTLFPECGFTELAWSNVPWSASYVRKYCNEQVYRLLPDCVQELVKEVVKKTVIDLGTGDGEHPCDLETTTDKVFILSLNEAFPDENIEALGHTDEEAKMYRQENPHYSYYLGAKTGAVLNKVKTYYDWDEEKYMKKYGNYWLRSPALSLVKFTNLYHQHFAGEGFSHEMNSYNRIGVAPAFAI